jgi:hypothetical protein
MISDILSDTVSDIDQYLGNPLYDDWYRGALRDRIIALRNEADAIRVELDTPQHLIIGRDQRRIEETP